MAPVTEKDCYAVMEKRLGQKSFDVLSFSFEPFPELMGFHGAHAMLRISVKTNGKEKKYSFFVKTATKSQVLFDEYYEPMRFFFKEHILMTKVIDELQAQITKKLTAKCYLSKLNKFLVFEDLGESGFEVIRGKMLDLAHSKLAAEAFADLHAASFILEDKGARLDLEYPEIIFETFFSPVAGTDNFLMKSVDSGLRKVAKKICPYVATNVQEQVLTKLLHAIEELAKPSKKYKNVLCQGDPWGNNLMYRYQGEVPKECILVDFQTSRFAPPALELMQFLYVATEKSFRNEHSKTLMDTYYRRLAGTLEAAGIDVNSYLTRKELDESCTFYKEFGIATRLHYSYIVAIPGRYLRAAAEDERVFLDLMIGHNTTIPFEALQDEGYKSLLMDALDDAVEFYTTQTTL